MVWGLHLYSCPRPVHLSILNFFPSFSSYSLHPLYSSLCSPSSKFFPEKNTVFSRLVQQTKHGLFLRTQVLGLNTLKFICFGNSNPYSSQSSTFSLQMWKAVRLQATGICQFKNPFKGKREGPPRIYLSQVLKWGRDTRGTV